MNKILEICIDSPQSAVYAQAGGADRVELCDNLYEGGTTPSTGMIKIIRSLIDIKLHVIIRPRGGDFLYSNDEFSIMKEDIKSVRDLGSDGVVLGILEKDGNIDIDRTMKLVELAKPMSVTFHRAFDMSPEPFKALDDIIETGADRLLTSGQANSVIDGLDLLRSLKEYAGNRIIIMPGAGINKNNLAEVVKKSEANEFHLTARKTRPSLMEYQKQGIYMGGLDNIPEFKRQIASRKRISKIREILDSFN